MLTHLLSFQPPLPCCVSCLQAKHPDEKFKILMTRCLITPPCVFITVVFSATTSTWREVKGSHFLIEQKQQAACDLWTVRDGSRDQAASWEHSCPEPQPFCSLSFSLIRVWDSSWETLFQTSGNCWKKIQKTVGGFSFLLFGMLVKS